MLTTYPATATTTTAPPIILQSQLHIILGHMPVTDSFQNSEDNCITPGLCQVTLNSLFLIEGF